MGALSLSLAFCSVQRRSSDVGPVQQRTPTVWHSRNLHEAHLPLLDQFTLIDFIVFFHRNSEGSPSAGGTVTMLPTHTTNSRTFNTHPTARVSLKSYIGRPLLRYIPVVLGCVVTLWLFGPVFLGILPPGPPGLFRPPPPRPPPPPTIWTVRAEAVRSAFVHAYSGYEKHAFPADELLPVTGGKIDK